MTADNVRLVVDDKAIEVPPRLSIIEAVWHAGDVLVEEVGCLSGVCGSCRVMVRRRDSRAVSMELACHTLVEDGMHATFLTHLDFRPHHAYRIEDFDDSWDVLYRISEVFPEAAHCRHCGGCDSACPKGIEVERGVRLAVEGRVAEAGALFEQCVMCNLCTRACPEHIGPNHLGLACRRLKAALGLRPANLMRRLEELRRGELDVST